MAGRVFDDKPISEFFFPPTGMLLRLTCSREQYQLPTYQVDHQAQFYERYRGVAEEYDKGFIKKYDEDLNTTLIFVSVVHIEPL